MQGTKVAAGQEIALAHITGARRWQPIRNAETGRIVGYEMPSATDARRRYHVVKRAEGWHCDCRDATFRGHGGGCKHCEAAMEFVGYKLAEAGRA